MKGEPSTQREQRDITPDAPADITRWAALVNEIVAARARPGAPNPTGRPLLHLGSHRSGLSVIFSGSTAHFLVKRGLSPVIVCELAAATGVHPRDTMQFVDISSRTLSRLGSKGVPLPVNAAVNTMSFVELAALALDVYERVEDAAGWLTTPHPMLDGQTPLQHARTPWGMDLVRSILGGLKWGFAA